MNLKDFVKDVIVSIDNAVEDARGETKRDVHLSDTKESRTVEFDVAVSVEESDTKSGKAGIHVLQFADAGGKISKESKNSTVSRVKFGVFISPQTKDERDARDAENEAYNQKRLASGPDYN